ncbi:MAG: ATPase [Treponema sp.]|jgi:hypothetical protein|nr:ATPase [Treponema sp.]
MEELQSTEILDREILEDARKKAYRILKTADETVKTNASVWEKKIAGAIAEMESRYAARKREVHDEIMARLPMDKRRAKSEKIEEYLASAVDHWYRHQSPERVLALLEAELQKRLSQCPEFTAVPDKSLVTGKLRNIKKAEAEPLLKKLKLSGCTLEELPSFSGKPYPEIVLDIKPVRITASIDMVVDTLLHVKRAELITALIGSEALNADEGDVHD